MIRQIEIPQSCSLSELFGNFDSNLKLLEKSLGVKISGRDSVIKINGSEEEVEKAEEVLDVLLQILARGEIIDEQKIIYAVTMVQENGGFDLSGL